MKTSNKILLGAMIVILVILTVSAAFLKVNVLGDVTVGDGNVQQQTRTTSEFNKIDVSGNFHVFFTQDGPARVMVTADNNLLEYIVTEVVDGELKVYTRNRLKSRELKLDINTMDIQQIKASAGASIFGQNMISAPALTLLGSSGSRMELEAMVEDLIVKLSSGSHASLGGQAQRADYSASSGSKLEAYDLEALSVTASASSGSNLEVNAQEELSMKASSGANINYAGKPIINELSLSSGAAVHQRSR